VLLYVYNVQLMVSITLKLRDVYDVNITQWHRKGTNGNNDVTVVIPRYSSSLMDNRRMVIRTFATDCTDLYTEQLIRKADLCII